jgi:hypothetical protein
MHLWRKAHPLLNLPMHDFVSNWHCRHCHSKATYLNRRARQELKDYLRGATHVQYDENGKRIRDIHGRFAARIVLIEK